MRAIILTTLTVGASATAAAQRPSEPAVPAQAKTDFARLLSEEDYPAAARAAGEQGVVEFTLTVGPSGRVSACTIARSSGSAALDSATCRLMRSRARFAPARDSDGAPRYGAAAGRISWTLPGAPPAPAPAVAAVAPALARAPLASLISDADYPASALAARQQGAVGFTLHVAVNGRVEGCTITRSSGSAALDATTCRLLRSRARFTPSRDSAGNPAPGTAQGEIRWTLPGVPAADS